MQPLVSYAIDTSFMMLARRDGSDGTGSVEAIDLVQEVLTLSCFAPSSEGWFRTLCCKKLNWFESEGQFERGLVRDGFDGTGQDEAIDLVQKVMLLMLCSTLHCKKCFNLILYKLGRHRKCRSYRPGPGGSVPPSSPVFTCDLA